MQINIYDHWREKGVGYSVNIQVGRMELEAGTLMFTWSLERNVNVLK